MKLRETQKTSSQFSGGLSRKLAVLAVAGALGCAGAEQRPARIATVNIPATAGGMNPAGGEVLRESETVVVPSENRATFLRATVLTLEHLPADRHQEDPRVRLEEIDRECQSGQGSGIAGNLNVINCIMEHAMNEISDFTSASYNLFANSNSLQGARLIFEYYQDATGRWAAVPGCEDVEANAVEQIELPLANGQSRQIPFYFAECDISVLSGSARTDIRVTFVPRPGQSVSPSSGEYELRKVTRP